jgi:hypothetical protein
MPEQDVDGIQIGFDREFIDKWLNRQKYVWALVIGLLAVTFSGLLGRGPLGKETVSAGPGQLTATFDRIPHYKTPAVIELQLPQSAFANGTALVRLEGAVTRQAAFERIMPQPVSAHPLPDGVVAEIQASAASRGGRVLIFQQPSAVGPLRSTVALEGGPSLELTQFVLP